MVSRDLKHSTELMETLYGYTEHTVLEYSGNDQQGELIHAAESAN